MQLFDYSQVGEKVSNPKKILDTALHLKFLDSDNNLAKRTYNELFILRRITLAYLSETKDLKNQGISCVGFLKREYDIADWPFINNFFTALTQSYIIALIRDISVSDNGMLPKKIVDEIFQLFFTAN